MRWPSLRLMGEVIVHPLHGQSTPSGMENPSGRQIGTKVSTIKMDIVNKFSALAHVLQSSEVKL
jgi:hypothetical protein